MKDERIERLQRMIAAAKPFEQHIKLVQQFKSPLELEVVEQARKLQGQMALTPRLTTLVNLNNDLFRFQRDWRVFSETISPKWLELGLRHSQLVRGITPALESFRKATELFQPLFEPLYLNDEGARRSEAAGWLPHRTTPFDQLAQPDLSDTEVAAILHAHYVEGWDAVRAAFVLALDSYAIDDIAKAAVVEALDNHQDGRHRSVVALMFNEIERVVRDELYGGGPAMIGSLPRLQDLAGDVFLSSIEPGGGAGLRLFERLVGHLYSQVKTVDEVAGFAADPVPNRHAATHGLVVYDTVQNSLNTLIMADYVFQVITLAKVQASEDQAA